MYDYEPCDFCPNYCGDGSCVDDCETIKEFRRWMKFIAKAVLEEREDEV